MRRTFFSLSSRLNRPKEDTLLPKRMFLVRHGESEANIDRTMYSRVPDWKIPLSLKGKAQAVACGKELRASIGNGPVLFYSSPYERTRQTTEGILKSFDLSQVLNVREETRLREQEMGNYQPADVKEMDRVWAERNAKGRFFYRFRDGESGADVCDRISSFLDTLFLRRQFLKLVRDITDDTIVLVMHGLMMRVFISRWYKLPIEIFDSLYNPANAQALEMTRSEDTNTMALSDKSIEQLGVKAPIDGVSFSSSDFLYYYMKNIV